MDVQKIASGKYLLDQCVMVTILKDGELSIDYDSQDISKEDAAQKVSEFIEPIMDKL